jgi:uncharacterized protein YhbP (UPF0306 family)
VAEFLAGWHVADGFDSAVVRARAHELLHVEGIGAFSVVSRGQPSIWTCFLAVDAPDCVSILTSRSSEHGAALGPNSGISMNVFRRPKFWGAPIFGVQARGVVESVGQSRSEAAYARRFPEYSEWIGAGGTTDSSFFSIRFESIKMIDEETFGEETYVVMRAQ